MTQEMPAEIKRLERGIRGCVAGQGGALRWGATITRLGALGYSL